MIRQEYKEKVVEHILSVIREGHKDDYCNHLAEVLERKHRFPRIELMKYWGLQAPLDDLEDYQLCAIYMEMNQTFHFPDPKQYFTEAEILQANTYVYNGGSLRYPLVFENVYKLNEDHWIIPMPIKMIYDLQTSGLLIRDQSVQRESVQRRIRGKEYTFIKLYPKAIKSITKALLQHNYYPDEIMLNLNNDDGASGECEYDEATHTLEVRGGNIMLVDGNHRVMAIEAAMMKNPDLDVSFPVTFTFFPLWKARSVIAQREKKNPVAKSVVASYENSTENTITRRIANNEDLDDALKNKIVTSRRYQGTISFNDISDAIGAVYGDRVRRMAKILPSWIVSVLNEIVWNNEELFNDLIKTDKEYWILDKVGIYTIVTFSEALYGDESWEEKLKNAWRSIDFSRKNVPDKIDKRAKIAAEKIVQDALNKQGG